MFDLISATPAQKRTISDLREKYRCTSVWVEYAEKPTNSNQNNNIRILMFAGRYIHDFTITVDGYLKRQTSYANEEKINP